MDTFDVALTFADSAHGGDRRKKFQQCGFSWDLMPSLLVVPKGKSIFPCGQKNTL